MIATGGMRSRRYDAKGGGGGDKRKRRSGGTQDAVEKVRETGGNGMIIDELLCLFLLRKLPILLALLSLSPLHGRITRKSRKQAKCDAKDGIISHNNRKDLGIPNSLLF